MSKLNILGILTNIKSTGNIYTPIVEAVVNSIEAINEEKRKDGEISIIIKRENEINFDNSEPTIESIEIVDNGIGFNTKNRNSFDTFYSALKRQVGGKGFGRFMFIKYFKEVKVESIYKENEKYFKRTFSFGREYDIIINEKNIEVSKQKLKTSILLNYVDNKELLDKGIETISRKLLEKLLIFFINDKFNSPEIVVKEANNNNSINLKNYLSKEKEIQLIGSKKFELNGEASKKRELFNLKILKIYYAGSQRSKICLTAHNREVTEATLHSYIPEFEDDFYDEIEKGNKKIRKNYIIKSYVLGDYLNTNVSLEREAFNFPKDKSDKLFSYSQKDIEKQVAEITKEAFEDEVKIRTSRKNEKIKTYINDNAPWHKSYMNDLDFSNISYNVSEEKIEFELQKIKFNREQTAIREIRSVINDETADFDEKLDKAVSKITEIGKSDLAHYVFNRKIILQTFQELLKRRKDGKGELEKEVHNIIFPMGGTSETTKYEDHNLWLLDERLVFSEYIASDKKISTKNAPTEPDLLIFNQKKSFRAGENDFSNPLTIFEFKRPKRENYTQNEDPVLQIANYLEEIREGKFDTPEGLDKIKVNDSTPVYGYIICDLTKKIHSFAKQYQLTISADKEGYFGYHTGFKMYIEIISFRKMLKDANLRNKIFFKKLGIE